jgi:hypothetical protein
MHVVSVCVSHTFSSDGLATAATTKAGACLPCKMIDYGLGGLGGMVPVSPPVSPSSPGSSRIETCSLPVFEFE